MADSDLKCHSESDSPALPSLIGSESSEGIDERVASHRHAGACAPRHQGLTEVVQAHAAAQADAVRPRPAFETCGESALLARRQSYGVDVDVGGHGGDARTGAIGDAGAELALQLHFLQAFTESRFFDISHHQASS